MSAAVVAVDGRRHWLEVLSVKVELPMVALPS